MRAANDHEQPTNQNAYLIFLISEEKRSKWKEEEIDVQLKDTAKR